MQTAFVEHDGFQCGQKLHASGAAQSAWPGAAAVVTIWEIGILGFSIRRTF
jgi:hypothetical protein